MYIESSSWFKKAGHWACRSGVYISTSLMSDSSAQRYIYLGAKGLGQNSNVKTKSQGSLNKYPSTIQVDFFMLFNLCPLRKAFFRHKEWNSEQRFVAFFHFWVIGIDSNLYATIYPVFGKDITIANCKPQRKPDLNRSIK
jgi:hypothetical protein